MSTTILIWQNNMADRDVPSAPPILGLEDWRQYLRDGNQFLGTALRAHQKDKKTFTPEISYNLTAMAIEKFFMAFLMANGQLADNHTMGDLIGSVERLSGPQPELAEKLRWLDSFQELCHLDTYHRTPPTESHLPRILALGQEVQRFVLERLPK